MANLLEETRNLMPGRARSHWNLTESIDEMSAADASLDWKGAAEKLLPKRTGKGQDDLYYRAYLRAIIAGNQAQATHLAKQFKPARDARRDLIDAVGLGESVEGYNVASKGAEKALRPATKEDAAELRRAVKKIAQSIGMNPRELSVKWINKRTVDIYMPHPLGAPRAFHEKVYKYLAKNGWGEFPSGGLSMPNWPKDARGIVAPIGNLMKVATLKGESIVGAAGPFAISDAPAPTPQDQVADLLDRVRSPRWEYPSWALPKVKLDEAAFTTSIHDKSKGEDVEVSLEVLKDGTVKSGSRVVGRVQKSPGERGRWFGEDPNGKTVSERNTKKSVLRDMAAHSIGVRLLGMPR